jgi:hypothetical protein
VAEYVRPTVLPGWAGTEKLSGEQSLHVREVAIQYLNKPVQVGDHIFGACRLSHRGQIDTLKMGAGFLSDLDRFGTGGVLSWLSGEGGASAPSWPTASTTIRR